MDKRTNSASDVLESIKLYLGEENDLILNNTPEETKAILKSLNIDFNKSCFVKGSKELLKQFKAFFLLMSAYSRRAYSTFMLKDYVQGLTDSLDDETFLTGSERELLFLYLHGGQAGFGNTEPWMWTTTVDRVANRNRKGLITVILSEREVPMIEEATTELVTYNLGGVIKAKAADTAAAKMATTSTDSTKPKSSAFYD